MKRNIKNNNKGFTIIEVLIVLVIAGLIMLIVFLAVPALQRNSRNTQRKNDVASIISAVQEYKTNKGAAPTAVTDFIGRAKLGYYASTDVILATGNTNDAFGVALQLTSLGTVPAENKVAIALGGKCNDAGTGVGGSNPSSKSVVAVYGVESGGGSTIVCTES